MPLPSSPIIEKYFPVMEVSEKSRREKAKGAPVFDLLYWWTRKPLTATRAVIATAVTDLDPEKLRKAIALDDERPYIEKPNIRVEGVKLLDPFAGGGSIPFEALRMGIDVTAVELLPVAYILLKATLEYPIKYGSRLAEDVEKWGKELIKRLEEKVGHLYRKGDLTYIGTWFIKCPKCGFWTPLIDNWWLDKKKRIWMKPVVENDKFRIEITKEGNPPEGTISGGIGTCIKCRNTIDEKYIKESLRKYLDGDRSQVEPRFLAVVYKVLEEKRGFRPATDDDMKPLLKAEEEIRELIKKGDPDIPTELLAEFGSTIRARAHGFYKWYQLFNSRQLLTLVTLTKLIREIGKEIEEQKKREGLSPEDAKEYAKAVVTYLAFMLCKHADYNSIVTAWHSSKLLIAHTMSFHGISMTWNFCEVNPFVKTSGSLENALDQILKGLKFATSALRGVDIKVSSNASSSSEIRHPDVKILLASATELPLNEKYDLIVTDPPYYDDEPYAELSDFFYVWLKRVLGEYYPEAFHFNTQWEELALQEVSVNPARFKVPNAKRRAVEHFRMLLKKSMKECYRLLKDDGLLVVFFAHSSVNAWRDLVEALQSAGFVITRTWPVHTEKMERVTALGKAVIDTSLIVVARKRAHSGDVGYIEELRPKIIATVKDEVKRLVQEFNLKGADLINAAMGPALRIITQYDKIERASVGDAVTDILKIVEETVVPAFLEAKLGSQMLTRLDPYASFYIYTRISYSISEKEKRLVLPFDHANRIAMTLGISMDDLVRTHVVKYVKSKGRKGVEIIIPRGDLKNFAKERDLDLNEPTPRSIIDVVHMLEVAYSLKGSRGVNELYIKLKRFRGFDIEAIKTTIQVLYTGLDEGDPEKPLLKPLINLDFKAETSTLEKFFR